MGLGSASLKKQASAVLDTTIKTTAPERRALDSARDVCVFFYFLRDKTGSAA